MQRKNKQHNTNDKNFFARKLEDTLSSMWADGSLNEAKVERFRSLHEHTPYK
jgi:hypothetical protein